MIRVRRQPVVDAYVEDGRVAIYSEDGEVLVLSELATRAWLVLSDEWTSIGEVADELFRQFGAPPSVDVLEATSWALEDLADHGVVVVERERT